MQSNKLEEMIFKSKTQIIFIGYLFEQEDESHCKYVKFQLHSVFEFIPQLKGV